MAKEFEAEPDQNPKAGPEPRIASGHASQQRLDTTDWSILVEAWVEAQAGGPDRVFNSDAKAWLTTLRETMPINPASPDMARIAHRSGSPELIDIVYAGVTPRSHCLDFVQRDAPIDRMVFDGLKRFHDRFKLKPDSACLKLMVQYALNQDDPALLATIMRFTEQDLLACVQEFYPDILEDCGPGCAATIGDYVVGWTTYSPFKAGWLLRKAIENRRAKTITALFSGGYDPYKDENIAHGDTPLIRALRRPDSPEAEAMLPKPLRDMLICLHPDIPCSAHVRLRMSAIIPTSEIGGATPQTLEKILEQNLGKSPGSSFAGLSLASFEEHAMEEALKIEAARIEAAAIESEKNAFRVDERGVSVRRTDADNQDSSLTRFLSFLDDDIAQRREAIIALSPALVDRLAALTDGVETDLNAPIDGDVDL